MYSLLQTSLYLYCCLLYAHLQPVPDIGDQSNVASNYDQCEDSVDGDYTIHTEKDYRFNYTWLVPRLRWLIVQVQACKEAHLLLTTQLGHNSSAGSIRVVIGGNNNTWNEIAIAGKDGRFEQKVRSEDTDILSCDSIRSFWISWAGKIQLGRGCEAFLNSSLLVEWNLSTSIPRPIKAATLSTRFGAIGEWRIGAHQLEVIHVLTSGVYTFTHFDAILAHRPYMKLALKGDGPFHIALSTSYRKMPDTTYEILIGGENGSACIRNRPRDTTPVAKGTGPTITKSSFTHVWVSWENRIISAGQGMTLGRQQFLSWLDTGQLDIKIISLATSTGPGEWVVQTPDMMKPEECAVTTINQTAVMLTVTTIPGMGTIKGIKVNYSDEDNNLGYTVKPVDSASLIVTVYVSNLTPGTIYTFSSRGYTDTDTGDSCTTSGKTKLGNPRIINMYPKKTSIRVTYRNAPGKRDGYLITCVSNKTSLVYNCSSNTNCQCTDLTPNTEYTVFLQTLRQGFNASQIDLTRDGETIKTSSYFETTTTDPVIPAAKKSVVPIVVTVLVVVFIIAAVVVAVFLFRLYRVGPFRHYYRRQRDDTGSTTDMLDDTFHST